MELFFLILQGVLIGIILVQQAEISAMQDLQYKRLSNRLTVLEALSEMDKDDGR